MIETTILSFLRQELQMDEVYLEIPKQMPDDFVVFTLIDREQVNHIDAATFRFNSYAKTKAKAARLDAEVRSAMEAITRLSAISSSKLGGGDDAPDDALGRYRYRCYYNLVY